MYVAIYHSVAVPIITMLSSMSEECSYIYRFIQELSTKNNGSNSLLITENTTVTETLRATYLRLQW